ncbi:hypothetical protein L211DRAFT_850665 [Terfezia boudieri ATCC MYA-4762]|uniref:Uncharacterized protein n=1 Tax=Terfezia boudieri ATCC MYA-4762 TaxID=1051890 RepID=A0A3N4LHK7_9PEZI|nr:hypothetical protein L211DRAFT_850665 [Terfezia boudieri ATCC MYA-4762]
MKPFTTLTVLTAAAMAGPSIATGEAASKGARELPLSQCGIAVELDFAIGSVHQREIYGPPDYWCCDGYTEELFLGSGKRVCFADGSVWLQPGYMKSLKPVNPDVTFLKTGKRCDGDCRSCGVFSRLNFPGFATLKKDTC